MSSFLTQAPHHGDQGIGPDEDVSSLKFRRLVIDINIKNDDTVPVFTLFKVWGMGTKVIILVVWKENKRNQSVI